MPGGTALTKKRVLVTGGAGTIGTVTRPRLLERFELSILDLKEVEGVETHVADISDLDAIRPAFEGKDAVVHLGGDPRGQAPWESVLSNNIVGVRNVLEASRLAGVARVVFASTNHVVGFHPEKNESYKALFEGRFGDIRQPMELLTTEQTRPCCLYGVSKGFGELMGSFYHDRYGMSFIALRIGGVLWEEGWERKWPSGLAMLLSHRDAAQLLERSIDAPPSVGFAIVYGLSDNTMKVHELDSAKQLLGYCPQDDAGTELEPGLDVPAYYEMAHGWLGPGGKRAD